MYNCRLLRGLTLICSSCTARLAITVSGALEILYDDDDDDDVNVRKTEYFLIAVHRLILPDVSQHPWQIGTKFQKLPPCLRDPGSQCYDCV